MTAERSESGPCPGTILVCASVDADCPREAVDQPVETPTVHQIHPRIADRAEVVASGENIAMDESN